jgi:DNA-binding transcriptional MerR regulator/effector-binding domain-containing protein
MVMLTIGAFSRLAAVSIKTLRYYDRAGVFRPAHVDPRSGYRYYKTDQLATLRELRLLRELGCSVANLRTWTADHRDADRRTALLLRLRGTIYHRLGDDFQRLVTIDRWIRQRVATPGESREDPIPMERRIPNCPAYTLRDRVRVADAAVYRMFEAAERTVARQHARTARPPFLLLHDDVYRRKNADVEVCIPIHPAALTAIEGRTVEELPRAACLKFSGSYHRAPAAYRTIKQWLRIGGTRSGGPLRESYIRFGADQRGYVLPEHFIAATIGEYRTELQVPLAMV